MTDEIQALCFLAGANSIFVGDTLLTAGNPGEDQDAALFRRLGIEAIELDGEPARIVPLGLLRNGMFPRFASTHLSAR
jgi:biotin synthase-like enzyme